MLKKNKVIFVIVLLFSAVVLTGGVSKGKFLNYDSLILENKYVLVEVVPEIGGTIVRFTQKSDKTEYLHLYQEKKTDQSPLLQIAIRQTEYNFGGLKDWFRESGVTRTFIPYNYRIVNGGPENIIVELTRDPKKFSQVVFRKTLEIRENDACLYMTVAIDNNSGSNVSYWLHGGINIGGDFEFDSVELYPVAQLNATKRTELVNQSGNRAQEKVKLFKAGGILERLPDVKEDPSLYVMVSQPWRAVYDKARKHMLVTAVNKPENIIEQMVFYSCCFLIWDEQGETFGAQVPMLSEEFMFPPTKPGNKATYKIVFSILPYIDNVVWACPSIAVGITENAGRLKLSVAAATGIPEGNLTLLADGKPCNTIMLNGLLPGEIRTVQTKLNAASAKRSVLEIEYEADGTKHKVPVTLNRIYKCEKE